MLTVIEHFFDLVPFKRLIYFPAYFQKTLFKINTSKENMTPIRRTSRRSFNPEYFFLAIY